MVGGGGWYADADDRRDSSCFSWRFFLNYICICITSISLARSTYLQMVTIKNYYKKQTVYLLSRE